MSKHNNTPKQDDIRNVKILIDDNDESRKFFEIMYNEIKEAQHSQQNVISIISAFLDKPIDYFKLMSRPDTAFSPTPYDKDLTIVDTIVLDPNQKRILVELQMVRKKIPWGVLSKKSGEAYITHFEKVDSLITLILMDYVWFEDKSIKHIFSFNDPLTHASLTENVRWITFEIPKIENLSDEDEKSLNDRAKSWLKMLNADTERKLREAVVSSDIEQVYEDVMRYNRDPEFREQMLQDFIRDSKT
jgi:hypothetical protein